MSDSFADLWSSSAPIPPKQKPQTLSSASSTSASRPNLTANSGSKPDVFALLSSSGTSTPASRYGNGSSYTTTSSSSSSSSSNLTRTTPRPSNPPSRTMTPSMSSQVSSMSTGTGTRSDAFSDLFASSSTTPTSNMTLAARLAMEAEQRGSRTSSPGLQNTPSAGTHQANDAAWAGLDSLGGGMGMPSIPSVSVTKPNVVSGRAPIVDEEDDWGLGDFGKPTSADTNIAPTPAARHPKPRTQTTAQSIAQAAQAAEKKKGGSLWDMDEFSGGAQTSSSAAHQQTTQRRKPNTVFDGDEDDHVDSPDVDFDFGSREDQEAPNKPRHKHKEGLLDFDDDGDAGYGQASARGHVGVGGGGGREEEGDDILGMLGRPVQAVRTQRERERERESESTSAPRTRNTPSDTTTTKPPSHTRPHPPSPPPHILGQIVEMGFSVAQARQALSATKDGQDVQAALEALLNGSGDTAEAPSHRERHPQSQHTSPPPPPVPTRPRGAPKGQKERERERLERQRQQQQQQPAPEGSSSLGEMQDHADRLLAQASEIGSSVFSKASAFWKEGREKVVKAYEERTSANGPGGGGGGGGAGGNGGGGRPKWMQEVVHPSDDEDGYERETSAFKDDHDQELSRSRSSHHDPVSSQQQRRRKAEAANKVHEQEVDLFSMNHDPEPQPLRHRKDASPQPRAQAQASSSSSMRSSPSRSQSSTSRPAPPIPVPSRNLITASPSALSLAQKHKTEGTERFKLGQHGPAAESYSSAISALPVGHLLVVPLHTNRALTRLRTGEYAGAVEDCERAVEGIFGRRVFANDDNPSSSSSYGIEDPLAPVSKSTKSPITPPPLLDASSIPAALIAAGRSRANGGGWTHPQGIGVDLLDSYTKALRRAAEAFEGRERWVEACAWWGVLSRAGEGEGAGWVDEKARKEAIAGGVRCRKMVDGNANGSSTGSGSQEGLSSVARAPSATSRPKSKPKPSRPPPPPIPKSTEPSKALQALQSTTAQAEADDLTKHALKDTVDARLLAWKAGKETNVRALLASLDTVLWEGASGIQGLKMGMADLVSAGQVKKGYVKAISRVHPDKLNAGNSTVEQRMLANGVFATLNEAWIAFQATQK